jgi:hypothetical protein
MVQHCKSFNTIQKQRQNHIIVSIDTVKAFESIQYPFMIKALMKLAVEGMYFNVINAIYYRPRAKIILNLENLKTFPKEITN